MSASRTMPSRCSYGGAERRSTSSVAIWVAFMLSSAIHSPNELRGWLLMSWAPGWGVVRCTGDRGASLQGLEHWLLSSTPCQPLKQSGAPTKGVFPAIATAAVLAAGQGWLLPGVQAPCHGIRAVQVLLNSQQAGGLVAKAVQFQPHPSQRPDDVVAFAGVLSPADGSNAYDRLSLQVETGRLVQLDTGHVVGHIPALEDGNDANS
uniref:Uncharacterized protein n=1 Tax=uncultured marine virus TaxID=186617 RepID=A0A0F7L6H3_9VIRU|nr:hypothetical protein [uncultured marine virus]